MKSPCEFLDPWHHMLLLPDLIKKIFDKVRNLCGLISWLALNVLQTQLLSTFGVTLTIRRDIPAKNIITIILNDLGLSNNRGCGFLKKRIDENIVPGLLFLEPKIFDLSRISKVCRLNNEVIVDISPSWAPGSTPNGIFSLSDLIEGVSFDFREHLENGGPEGLFWSVRAGSPERRVPKTFGFKIKM